MYSSKLNIARYVPRLLRFVASTALKTNERSHGGKLVMVVGRAAPRCERQNRLDGKIVLHHVCFIVVYLQIPAPDDIEQLLPVGIACPAVNAHVLQPCARICMGLHSQKFLETK
jgi:hypothetical protein